ncbi:hypothetical protein [Nocardia sp. NRRL S-836]|uniref:hypothetical protein n=1 Tax=Nocardia sp. NRRL S-836 TaxID=1519492 RepID=UPI0012FABBC0|nr:hypothetical protein [Nocardia sp. NRRL S-836]
MTFRHAWVLPVLPVAVVLAVAAALVPVTSAAAPGERVWLLGVVGAAVVLAVVVAVGAGRLSGEPVGRPWLLAAATGVGTVVTPFVVGGVLGAVPVAPVGVPWLIFGCCAAYWQLSLCEGARSRWLHAAIGFGYTFVFTAVSLLFAVLSARVVD